MAGGDEPAVSGVEANGPISYAESRALARHEDAAVRRALAERSDVRPEILYFLADDPSDEVRRAIAGNGATPRQALALLAQDEITRVRQLLAETLKDVADAPSDVINRLARDSEIVVAGPVLQHSPVLTDDDILDVIAGGVPGGALNAISRRTGVSERISDAIVAADDDGAIAELLANDSAQIREQALDELIDRAPDRAAWHAPLVARPKLHGAGAVKLARFVADSLLETLKSRADLDAGTLDAVTEMVRRRIDAGGNGTGAGAGEAADAFLHGEPPVALAQRLAEAGRLDANVVAKAAQANDFAFVLASLMVLTGLPAAAVRRPFADRNAKGVVALAWKAGLPMALALRLQQTMARIPPSQIIAKGDAGYPLGNDEMARQVALLSKLGGARD